MREIGMEKHCLKATKQNFIGNLPTYEIKKEFKREIYQVEWMTLKNDYKFIDKNDYTFQIIRHLNWLNLCKMQSNFGSLSLACYKCDLSKL